MNTKEILQGIKNWTASKLGGKVDKTTTVNGHALSGDVSVSKSDIGLGNVTNDAQVTRAEMGAASGVATLDTAGKVPSSQLPSYVDDVLEFNSKDDFPSSGETGKIYVDKTTNKTWRWGGTDYVEISQSLALGETSSTAYAGDKGKALADKLATIENGAEVNVQSDWDATEGDAFIKNKPTIPVVPTNVSAFTNDVGYLTQHQSLDNYYDKDETEELLDDKQDALVSGTNIKTINSQSILGSGDIVIEGGGNDVDVNYDTTNKKITKTINGVTSDIVTADTIIEDGGAADGETANAHYSNTSNPHSVTKAQVGLGSVVNTGDSATPVSGGTTKFTTGGAYTELAKKVDKVDGKGLSTNDYTTSEKNKLSGIESGAQVHKAPTAAEVKSALGTGSGTSKYLREDGSWQTPPDTNTWPTKTSQLTNDSGFLTGITKAQVTTALGYTPPTTDTNTTYSAGTGLSLSGTTFSVKTGYTTSGKNYKVAADNSGNLYVNVPWTDNNTTYSGSSTVTLSGTTFSLTKANVTTALGYTPPTSDTNTHWTTRIYAGASGTAANATATSPYIKITDDNTYRNQIRLIGSGATTVKSDGSGNITISSTDTNTDTNTWRTVQCKGTSIGNNTLNLKEGNNISLSNSNGAITIGTDSTIGKIVSIEFDGVSSGAGHGGFIDFHWEGNTSDYTSRIMEDTYRRVRINDVMYVGREANVGVGEYSASYKFYCTGAAAATSFVNTSDIRKKDIIENVDLDIEDIANAPIFKFTWLDPEMPEGVNVGTSAQYWQTIIPEIVSENDDVEKTLSMQYGVAGLVSSVALAKKVVEQENTIKAQEVRIKALEDAIAEIQNKLN